MKNIKFSDFASVTDFTELVGLQLGNNGKITKEALKTALGLDVTGATLDHFKYNPVTDKLEADRAIETTLNSLFLGEQHKMSSGSENIFFTNLSSDINFFPMWGGLKDQSIVLYLQVGVFIPTCLACH